MISLLWCRCVHCCHRRCCCFIKCIHSRENDQQKSDMQHDVYPDKISHATIAHRKQLLYHTTSHIHRKSRYSHFMPHNIILILSKNRRCTIPPNSTHNLFLPIRFLPSQIPIPFFTQVLIHFTLHSPINTTIRRRHEKVLKRGWFLPTHQ